MDEGHAKGVARQTRFMFILCEVVALGICVSALLDRDWRTAAFATGIGLWGGFIYWVCRRIFRFMGA